jgi:hypothetical protein
VRRRIEGRVNMDCLYGFLGEMVSLCFGRGDGKLQWRCKGKSRSSAYGEG